MRSPENFLNSPVREGFARLLSDTGSQVRFQTDFGPDDYVTMEVGVQTVLQVEPAAAMVEAAVDSHFDEEGAGPYIPTFAPRWTTTVAS